MDFKIKPLEFEERLFRGVLGATAQSPMATFSATYDGYEKKYNTLVENYWDDEYERPGKTETIEEAKDILNEYHEKIVLKMINDCIEK
jgi:hypothetical protein